MTLRFAHVSTAGSETTLIETPFGFPRMADISPDHARLLVLGFNGSESESPLWAMPMLGGTARRIGGDQAHDATWTPAWGHRLRQRLRFVLGQRAMALDARKLVTVAGSPFLVALGARRPRAALLNK